MLEWIICHNLILFVNAKIDILYKIADILALNLKIFIEFRSQYGIFAAIISPQLHFYLNQLKRKFIVWSTFMEMPETLDTFFIQGSFIPHPI